MLLLTLSAGVTAAPDSSASPADSVVLVRNSGTMRRSRGSGFVAGDGSLVITAAHVVSISTGRGKAVECGPVLVHVPWTGRTYEASIVGLHAEQDLAVLKLPVTGLPALRLAADQPTEAGAALQSLRAAPMRIYGFPLTYAEDTIASLARAASIPARLAAILDSPGASLMVLDPDASVAPGWSGGPVIREDTGQVAAVFQSLYRPQPDAAGQPCGILSGYAAPHLPPAAAAHAPVTRPQEAGELLAANLRYLSWRSLGNFSRAQEAIDEALKLAPRDPLLLAEAADLQLAAGNPGAAKTAAVLALDNGASLITPILTAGRAHLAAGENEDAVRLLQQATVRHPASAELRLLLSEALSRTTRPPGEEVSALEEAAARTPDHPGLLARLGQAQARAGQSEASLKSLQQATALAREDAELSWIHVAYGLQLVQARKFKDAEIAYRQAIKLDSSDVLAHYYLALLYFRLGRFDEAQVEVNAGIRQKGVSDSLVEAFRSLQGRINERGG